MLSRRRRLSLGLALVGIGVALAAPGEARPRVPSGDLQSLGRYDVLVYADPFRGGIQRGKAIGVIDATPEEVFRVATDYAKYQDYMPRVEASSVLQHAQDVADVLISIDLPWPVGRTWVQARYRHERRAGQIYMIRFEMTGGTMRQYVGSLYIEPWGPRKAALTYELVAQPGGLAPTSAVNRGVRRTASKFVHALRQRINQLHRFGYLHPLAQPRPERSPLVGGTLPKSPSPTLLKARR